MISRILLILLGLGVSAPVSAQVLSVPTNAGSTQRENTADAAITMNRARIDALKEMLFEQMEKLLVLEQQAQSLVAVKKNLLCCQLQGTDVPWHDDKTFINTANHGQVFLNHVKQEDERAAVTFNDKFKNEQQSKFDQLLQTTGQRQDARTDAISQNISKTEVQ